MEKFREFLRTTMNGEIPIHYLKSNPKDRIFLSSMLLPRISLKGDWVEQLLGWNFNPSDSEWVYSKKKRRFLQLKTFLGNNPTIIKNATPVITTRYNNCTKENALYFEVNPQIIHVHGLHWIQDYSAYCAPDDVGEIQKVIKVEISEKVQSVTVSDNIILKHLLLGNFVLVRFFDVHRWGEGTSSPITNNYNDIEWWHDDNIHARLTTEYGKNPMGEDQIVRIYLKGFQVILPPADRKDRKKILAGAERNYCKFIAVDLKHQRTEEFSCDPRKLGGFFTDSPFPPGHSPAFFKREVLRKYQDDPDKYTVMDREISCLSLWSLPFDVNEARQVHAFLIDLSHLPHSEQLHWKSNNEMPKGSVSRRSFNTDFLGEWELELRPLEELKELLGNFPNATVSGKEVQVWRPPSGPDADLMSRIHYLAGTSQKEWESAIGDLDKWVVEGLNSREVFQPLAKDLKLVTKDKEGNEKGSIILLKDILVAKGEEPDNIFVPLQELHECRSRVSHRQGKETAEMIREICSKNQSLDRHFERLVEQLLNGMRLLSNIIITGKLNST